MKRRYTSEDLFKKLVKIVESHATKKAAAESLGISQQYLGDLLTRTRPIGAVADRLGFAEVADKYAPVAQLDNAASS